MENPSSWTQVEKAIYKAQRKWEDSYRRGVIGASVFKVIADELREQGLIAEDTTSNLKSRVTNSADEHIALASKYERAGNVSCAMNLRKVGNLLYSLSEGEKGLTIYPDYDPCAALKACGVAGPNGSFCVLPLAHSGRFHANNDNVDWVDGVYSVDVEEK